MTLLRVADLHKSFDDVKVLQGVSFSVSRGEIVCLLGPSGCGKTTLLRIVAGLEQADGGELSFDGEDLTRIPVHRRGFGLMFQEFALFPHRSVGQNVAFGLRMAGWETKRMRERVEQMLDLVDLAGYESRSVFELSGGERQRVALARSLAPSPRLLMLDEPLGSLDRTLRESLMTQLRQILKSVGVTALYVTHDQQEAFAVADRVMVMNQGNFEQIGTPEDVYARPASPFVARFLGLTNLLEATLSVDGVTARTGIGSFRLPTPPGDGSYTLLIRPELGPENVGSPGDGGMIEGTLSAASFRGSDYHIDVEVSQEPSRPSVVLDFVLPTRHRRSRSERLPEVGDTIRLGIDSNQLVLLSA